MNDSDLEENLRALRPANPSPALEQRVRERLTPVAGTTEFFLSWKQRLRDAADRGRRWTAVFPWPRHWGWAAAGAAAAGVAIVLALPGKAPVSPVADARQGLASAPAPEESAAFEYAAESQELLAAEDSAELIETADGPVREVRYRFRERHAWANPRTGAQIVLEVPREDIYLLPVSLQ
jgi:hypothetical protein